MLTGDRMTKYLRYILMTALILCLGYFSVKIKPLDEVKKDKEIFDAAEYARNYLNITLPGAYEQAILLPELLDLIRTDKTRAFERWSHAVSIGNIRHFLVSGTGIVSNINEDEIDLMVEGNPGNMNIRVAMEFIYGSSIRDAAGLFDIKFFTSNADMNSVSAEINRIIHNEIIPPVKKSVKVGDELQFIAALEMNQKYTPTDNLEILPIHLRINPK